MARYIDADKFIDFLKKEKETAIAIGDGIRAYETQGKIKLVNSQPTADVVPKSEVEKIFEEIEEILIDNSYQIPEEFYEFYDKQGTKKALAELEKKYTEKKQEVI